MHERTYQYLLSAALLIAAWRLLFSQARTVDAFRTAVASGAVGGRRAGFCLQADRRVGGGIFLNPLLLSLRWANMRTTATVSTALILVNSLAGLAGLLSTSVALPSRLGAMILAALAGARHRGLRAGRAAARPSAAASIAGGGAGDCGD